MNKAFVREPEPDGRAYCPDCGSLGNAVGKATLDHHLAEDARAEIGDQAWFCEFPRCSVAYFDLFDRTVAVSALRRAVYPKDRQAAICPCFGFSLTDVDSAIERRDPSTIRELLAKSKTEAAQCSKLAADGRCCAREVQRLYIRGVSGG